MLCATSEPEGTYPSSAGPGRAQSLGLSDPTGGCPAVASGKVGEERVHAVEIGQIGFDRHDAAVLDSEDGCQVLVENEITSARGVVQVQRHVVAADEYVQKGEGQSVAGDQFRAGGD